MGRERAYRLTAACVVALLGILLLAHLLGVQNRRFVREPVTITATSAAEAYSAIRAEGIKGRILVVLDERSRIVPRIWMNEIIAAPSDSDTQPPVMAHNLTSSLIYTGVARRVYFVPPDGSWDGELRRMLNRPDALAEGNGARARFMGTPVHLTRSSDMPVIGEKIVVVLSSSVVGRYDPGFVARMTDSRTADVVVRWDE